MTTSEAAIRHLWPEFVAAVRDRLEVGEREYGDASFTRPAGELVAEVEQELLDVMGWGFILYCRMRELREKFDRL